MSHPEPPAVPDPQGGTPPPPPPPPAAAPAHTDPDEPSRRRRGVLVSAAAAVLLLVVPASVFAWRALDGNGTQPHDVLPGEAIGYFRIDLDPSATQKIEAFRFLRNFPAVEDTFGELADDVDLRERVFDELATGGCDIHFERDVEPWMGDRLGGALMPPENEESDPQVVIALQIDDEDAADAAIRDGFGCLEDDTDPIGRAYLDGYVLLAETQSHADRFAEAADAAPLSDNDEFTEAMKVLGDPGVASLWLSGTAFIDTFTDSLQDLDAADPFTQDPSAPSVEDLQAMFEDAYRSIAMAFRFDSSYGELAVIATGDAYQELRGPGVDADLPEDTLLMLGFANAGEYMNDAWDLMRDADPSTSGMLNGLAMTMGLSLPEDLSALLGDNILVAVDGGQLDIPSIIEFGDMSSVNVGARVDADPDAVREVWEKLQAWGDWAEVPLDDVPLEITGDGYVIASNPAYGNTLIEGGTLGASDAYRTAVKDAADAHGVMFLNFDLIEDALIAALAEPGHNDALMESLRAIEAIGYAAHIRDGYTEVTMRVTTD